MNQPPSPPPPPLPPAPLDATPRPTPDYRDRKAGLVAFGVIEILIGGFCALAIPLMLLGQFVAPRGGAPQLGLVVLLPTVFVYALLATAFVSLGIGSIRARRWARALLLCLGWIGLCVGVVSLVVMLATLNGLGEALQQQGTVLSPAAITAIKIFTVLTVIFLYIVIPGALVLFYRSPHVRRTCEVRDPVARWTDRCPLPVLAMCVLQALGAACILFMPGFGGAMPIAGTLVTGWAARGLWLGFGAFSLYAALGFYRLNPRAWLVYTVGVTFISLNVAYSLRVIDLADFYRASGYSEALVAQIMKNPMVRPELLSWLGAASIVPLLGLLIFLRRYFHSRDAAA